METDLSKLTYKQLCDIATQFNLPIPKRKDMIIHVLANHYYDLQKYLSYTYIEQLGVEGKDGRTFLAMDDQKKEVAIKIFRKNKKESEIEREAKLQIIAANVGIAPRVIEYSAKGKYIVMEKLDINLFDLFKQQGGKISTEQQRAVIKLFIELDKCKIFHGDPNPLNFMYSIKKSKWYIIDFGMSQKITSRNIPKYSDAPNVKYMPLGFKLKIQKINPKCKLSAIDKVINKFILSLD